MSTQPLRSIHVMAGVISDARGRILLARRTEGRDLAGRWEFPGGKREPGESEVDALVRELQEELGIVAEVGESIISVPQQYPDKRLRLDVRRIVAFKGTPRGHEGQALTWVEPDKLPRYPMPPADRPVVAALLHPDRYLVTPSPVDAEDDAWLAAFVRALENGARRVQLRLHGLDEDRRLRLARAAVEHCRRHQVEVLINGDIKLAVGLGTGVHLRAAQLSELSARPVADGMLVAASCHSAIELRRAEDLGCDFAVLGSVQETPSHPGSAALGWEGFAQLREGVSLPMYAIGGMQLRDVAEARQHGAQGIAAIRALWPDGDQMPVADASLASEAASAR